MSLLLFLLFGFFVGWLARLLMPGNQKMGFLMTAILGVVGSLLGGFLTSLIRGVEPLRVHKTGLLGSIIGAMIVLALGAAINGRKDSRS